MSFLPLPFSQCKGHLGAQKSAVLTKKAWVENSKTGERSLFWAKKRRKGQKTEKLHVFLAKPRFYGKKSMERGIRDFGPLSLASCDGYPTAGVPTASKAASIDGSAVAERDHRYVRNDLPPNTSPTNSPEKLSSALKQYWDHIEIWPDIFETPVTVTPSQEISKTLNSSKNSLKILSVTFWGNKIFTFGELTFTFGEITGSSRFLELFFLLLGGLGTPWVGGPVGVFENI